MPNARIVLGCACAVFLSLSCSSKSNTAPNGPPQNDGGDPPVEGDDSGILNEDGGADQSFIALDRDFKDYLSWEMFDLGVGSDDAGVHEAGPRFVYLNKRPPSGSTEFPKGTIIVKAIKNGPMSTWQVFAMVKRGNDFNFLGAVNWEWFELKHTDDGATTIKWRGIKAPEGEGYGGIGGGACNNCHTIASDNDYVQAPLLNLANF